MSCKLKKKNGKWSNYNKLKNKRIIISYIEWNTFANSKITCLDIISRIEKNEYLIQITWILYLSKLKKKEE